LTQNGFGGRLFEEPVVLDLDGSITLSYEASGVRGHIAVRL